MKKLSLILVLLLAFGFGAFAQPSVSGTLGTQLSFDDDADLGNVGKLRMDISFPVGDFVTVAMDIRNDAWASTAVSINSVILDDPNASMGADGDETITVDASVRPYFYFNQVYATTDLSGIFGIDAVSLTLKMGNYEEWISNWNSATSTNRARAVEYFAIGGADGSPDVGLDIGTPFGTIIGYLETSEGSDELAYKFGFKLGDVVDGLNAAVSYSGADGVSYMKAEAGYELALGDGMSLTIPVGFLMDLEGETMAIGTGVKFSGFGLGVNIGALLTDSIVADEITFAVLDAQLSYAVMDTGLTVYANMAGAPSEDVAGDDFIESLDFGVSYDLAGNMIYVGYVADLGDNATTTLLMMDDSGARHSVAGDGFYVVSRISF